METYIHVICMEIVIHIRLTEASQWIDRICLMSSEKIRNLHPCYTYCSFTVQYQIGQADNKAGEYKAAADGCSDRCWVGGAQYASSGHLRPPQASSGLLRPPHAPWRSLSLRSLSFQRCRWRAAAVVSSSSQILLFYSVFSLMDGKLLSPLWDTFSSSCTSVSRCATDKVMLPSLQAFSRTARLSGSWSACPT